MLIIFGNQTFIRLQGYEKKRNTKILVHMLWHSSKCPKSITLEGRLKWARNPVVLQTTSHQPENPTNTGCCDENNGAKIPDVSEFCNDFERLILVIFSHVNFYPMFLYLIVFCFSKWLSKLRQKGRDLAGFLAK